MDIFSGLPAIMVFYLIIFGGYTAQLLPCKLQNILSNSILLKHLIGYFTLVFFVVLTEKSVSSRALDITQVLMKSIIIYIVFLISARSNIMFWGIGTGLLLVYYVIDLYRKEHDDTKDKETGELLDSILQILGYLILTAYLTGIVLYLGEKRHEFGDKFNLWKFITGTVSCRDKNVKLESIGNRLLRGLYLK